MAAAQYGLERPRDWDDYAERLAARLKGIRADLVVLPEYAGLEMLAFLAPRRPLEEQLAALDLERYLALFGELARAHGLHILAGSLPVRVGERYRNRAYLLGPEGGLGWQDKLVLTPWERATGVLEAGDRLRVFRTRLGCLAVNICYDSEFPLLARRQARAGAEALLVPSCTEARTGYNRVRIACRARALENQILVVQSSVVGRFPDCELVDRNSGAAGLFVPPDIGFPDDGVLATGRLNRADMVVAEAPLARLELLRREGGEVATVRDWIEPSDSVERVEIG